MGSNPHPEISYGDLASCDAEPLKFLGSIQNRGSLLAFDPATGLIAVASSNAAEMFKLAPRQFVGMPLLDFVGDEFFESVTAQVRKYPWVEINGVDLAFEKDGQTYDVYLFASERLFCLEFERSSRDLDSFRESKAIDQTISDYVSALKDCASIEALAYQACRAIRSVAGMDRVMMYHFLQPSWDGVVLAEDRSIESHSYNRHHFPASDIPRQARELYLRNGIRIISDVQLPNFALEPAIHPLTQKPFDLSDSHLRAVSPIHVEYLNNMGVRSSLSVAVVIKGQLWGLIACHNTERALVLSTSARRACEMIGNAFAGQTQLLEANLLQASVASFEMQSKNLLRQISMGHDPIDSLLRSHQSVQDLFRGGGLAFASLALNHVDCAGLTPPRAVVAKLAKLINENMRENSQDLFASQNLASLVENWKELSNVACGVLAFRIGKTDGLLMIFRVESIQTVNWGGDPRKLLAKKGFTGRINPRLSFETWEQVIRDHSQAWEPYELAGAEFIRDFVNGLVSKEKI